MMRVLPHQHCGNGPLVFQMARCTLQLNGEVSDGFGMIWLYELDVFTD